MASAQLLSPFKLNGLQLANRVVMAPLTRARAGASRLANEHMAKYYQQRASAGLIVAEATAISPQGYGWYGAPALYTEQHAKAWQPVVDAVHARGGRIFLQAWHMGRQGHSSFHDIKEVVAPSAVGVPGELRIRDAHLLPVPYELPRALRTDEIKPIVDTYREGAKLAKLAGFDGIEVHAANGYLLDTFLQAATNHRCDAYGGSQENRFRILREVIEAIGSVFPMASVGVRLSPNRGSRGMGSADNHLMFPYIASQCKAYGLAYLHVIDGLSLDYHNKAPVVTLHDMKAHFQGNIMGNVGFTKDLAEGALRSGAVDLVSFGRPYLSNPDLVERFANGWPLNADCPVSAYYGNDPDPAKCLSGYLDFPTYKP